jgi:uncharacterized protein (TIGR00251 family)
LPRLRGSLYAVEMRPAADSGGEPPYRLGHGKLSLRVKVIANAGRSEVVGVRAGELVVKLRVPALEGRANRELLRLLSAALGISRSEVLLAAGRSSHHKLLRLPGEVAEALNALCRIAD